MIITFKDLVEPDYGNDSDGDSDGDGLYTWLAIRCDFCNWSTQYIGIHLSEPDAERWMKGEAEIDADASEEANEWVFHDHLREYFHIMSNKLYCKWCTDREILVRRWITVLDPHWLTASVKDLATSIRNELPAPYVLAPTGLFYCGYLHDALMDAGCDNETILNALATRDESVVRLLIDAINGRMSFGNIPSGKVATVTPLVDAETWANLPPPWEG